MTIIRRLFILAWFLIVLTMGCAPAPQSNSNSTVSTQPSPSPSASPSRTTTTDTASVHITLPLLDALLTDDKFVARVKENLKLNDQKIEELKNVSGAAVARLRESNIEDQDDNDATDAPARAQEQLRSVLGEEKARDLAKLANDYWSKGDTSEASNDNVQMLK